MKAPDPKPPPTLSAPARKFWRSIADEYDIRDSAGLAILNVAAGAFDRAAQAAKVIAREGLLVADRYGVQKPHPCTVIERDARGQMLAALRQLNLDLEPLQPRAGRPAGMPAKLHVV